MFVPAIAQIAWNALARLLLCTHVLATCKWQNYRIMNKTGVLEVGGKQNVVVSGDFSKRKLNA
jgi:hypothetical protein